MWDSYIGGEDKDTYVPENWILIFGEKTKIHTFQRTSAEGKSEYSPQNLKFLDFHFLKYRRWATIWTHFMSVKATQTITWKVEEVRKKFNHDDYISKICIMQTPRKTAQSPKQT